MLEWIKKFLYDETFFERCFRMTIFLAGELVRQGTIPTGVPGLGQKLGPIISALALLVAAGERNPKPEAPNKNA